MAMEGTGLTSTTAPGKTFDTRKDIADHYKSDWHRYNLKRREAGLPMLREEDFKARLEAALALRREREIRAERSGTGHLKSGKNHRAKGKGDGNGEGDGGTKERQSRKDRREAKFTARAMVGDTKGEGPDEDEEAATEMEEEASPSAPREEENPTIDPRQSLFDSHISPTVQANIERMERRYGFFVPDKEYLADLEGFLGYCHEKVKLGHYCLYCQKVFGTWSGCQKHMVDSRHCKIAYERGIDQDEFEPFYDFSEANTEFLQEGMKRKGEGAVFGDEKEEEDVVMDADGNDEDEDDDAEWEDISDDDEMYEEDDNIYEGYEAEIRLHGFDVTPLGELIFPDGRIVGHRGLSRYYRQRFAPDGEGAAVTAARRAAGERIYAGRVFNVRASGEGEGNAPKGAAAGGNTLALAKAGIVAGAAAGRSGRGILVSADGGRGYGGGKAGFTALSLYRYRAVVKKARREESQGYRKQQRTKNNMNKMDKKHNRLMNGVSVAHAAR